MLIRSSMVETIGIGFLEVVAVSSANVLVTPDPLLKMRL